MVFYTYMRIQPSGRNASWRQLSCISVLAGTIILAGCQKASSPSSDSSSSTAPATVAVHKTTDGTENSSPLDELKQQTADIVSAVKVFLEAVRTGDDEKVIQLFSEEARKQAGKLNRQFAPVGSDTARYEVFNEVEYLAPDGARVKSTWTDLDSQGRPRTDEITWMLRKESDGWRIAGMATVIFEGEPPLLLDFENLPETLKKIELLSQEIERRALEAEKNSQHSAANEPDQTSASAQGISHEPSSPPESQLPAAPVSGELERSDTTARESQPNVLR